MIGGTFVKGLLGALLGWVTGLIMGKSKDKTIAEQDQEITDLNVEAVESEAEKVTEDIKENYEDEKKEAGDDIDERLNVIKDHND